MWWPQERCYAKLSPQGLHDSGGTKSVQLTTDRARRSSPPCQTCCSGGRTPTRLSTSHLANAHCVTYPLSAADFDMKSPATQRGLRYSWGFPGQRPLRKHVAMIASYAVSLGVNSEPSAPILKRIALGFCQVFPVRYIHCSTKQDRTHLTGHAAHNAPSWRKAYVELAQEGECTDKCSRHSGPPPDHWPFAVLLNTAYGLSPARYNHRTGNQKRLPKVPNHCTE